MKTTSECFWAFVKRTGSEHATEDHFTKVFEDDMFETWTRESLLDSFVEWYDEARRGETYGVRSPLAAFESFMAPRLWVTLVALADKAGPPEDRS